MSSESSIPLTELEIAYNSTMDDMDAYIVKEAMMIYTQPNLTDEEKTNALWNLLKHRKNPKRCL